MSKRPKNTPVVGEQAHPHHHDHTHHTKTEHSHDHTTTVDGGTILSVRAVSGLSGDMMLAGLATMAELQQTDLDALVKELGLSALEGTLTLESRSVNHIAGIGCRIELPHEHAHRTFSEIRSIISASIMPDTAKELAIKAFSILAEAEGAVHGKSADSVTFHEVGALDSILDICLCCRIFTILSPTRFLCSPLPLADGAIRCAHGVIPSPAPAVLRMLEGVRVCGFPGDGETVTPTAVSLLKALGATFGQWPEFTVSRTAISYGSKIFKDAPNGALWAIGC